jgi:hypothetical protein
MLKSVEIRDGKPQDKKKRAVKLAGLLLEPTRSAMLPSVLAHSFPAAQAQGPSPRQRARLGGAHVAAVTVAVAKAVAVAAGRCCSVLPSSSCGSVQRRANCSAQEEAVKAARDAVEEARKTVWLLVVEGRRREGPRRQWLLQRRTRHPLRSAHQECEWLQLM